MLQSDTSSTHPLRKPLLIVEFVSLAILLGTMGWFSSQTSEGGRLSPLWLLVPAGASLGVFVSFIGLMYLRWVVAGAASNRFRHKLVFSFLAVTLMGVWVYGIANTWFSLQAS